MFVNGLYRGVMLTPDAGTQRIELRIDISTSSHGTVSATHHVSADVFDVPAGPETAGFSRAVFRESWIVDDPDVDDSGAPMMIEGVARFWQSARAPVTIQIRLVPGGASGATALVTVGTDRSERVYACDEYCGSHLREIELHVDVCRSVGPLMWPEYDTGSHPVRPQDLPPRVLTLATAWAEAGVHLTTRETGTISDPADMAWTNAELDDALTARFAHADCTDPRWALWGLLAGRHEDKTCAGIMFDCRSPHRQGFAIFRNHRLFASLGHRNDATGGADRPPPTPEDIAASQRAYLYAWMHEMGHAFNLVHSWHKLRPDALSWMNREDRYAGRGTFWEEFRFAFDAGELRHLRHGNRPLVIMGGEALSMAGNLCHHDFQPQDDPFDVSTIAESPAELRIKADPSLAFMSPVAIEVRIRNLSTAPFTVLPLLHPEDGMMHVRIEGPDGRVRKYRPIIRVFRQEPPTVLAPVGALDGYDRQSVHVDLTYGSDGFYFDRPGLYHLQAVFLGSSSPIVSNRLTLLVRRPSAQSSRLAQDFFNDDVGETLSLDGSQSPRRRAAFALLHELAQRRRRTVSGAYLASQLMTGVAAPFRAIENGMVTRLHVGDPEAALHLTDTARSVFERSDRRSVNLPHHRLAVYRARLLQRLGEVERARAEIVALAQHLARRGGRAAVLASVTREIAALSPHEGVEPRPLSLL